MTDLKCIVAFCGKAQSGKDTCADYLVKEYGFVRCAFADQLKEICRDIFGWDGEKDEKGRRLLQIVGTEAGRNYNENIWVERFANSAKVKSAEKIIIPDCRFMNELDWVRDNGGFAAHIIGRGGLQGEAGKHLSETSLDAFDNWDQVIPNTGTLSDLYLQVDSFFETIINGFGQDRE